MASKAFTLIELLVVIAIIALLLSIIMPSLNKAKTYAQEVICKNNARQYSLATEMYCNENDDKLPDAWQSLYDSCQGRCPSACIGTHLFFPDELNRTCRWHNPEYNLERYPEYAGPYWPYLAVTKANICPAFSKLAPKYGKFHGGSCIGEPFIPQFSYSMNARIFDGGLIKKNQLKSPSQTFLWAEENMWTLEGLSNYVLNDNALLVGTGNSIIDNFASFHKISSRKLSIQQDTRRYESGTGVSNVLLLDGSVTWLTPEQVKDYVGKLAGDF
jgi:prepilin-type N-terminal cleavage/methylation domain-containing protein